MKIRLIAASGTIFLVLSAIAAEKKIQMKDLPAAVQKAVQEQSKGAMLKGLTTEVENGKTNMKRS